MKLICVGAGGYFKSFLDSVHPTQFEIVGLLDDRYPDIQEWFGFKVIGKIEDAETVANQYDVRNFFVTIGDTNKRRVVYEYLDSIPHLGFPTIIDNTAVVSRHAVVGQGTFIGKLSMVNNDVIIGDYSILNSCSVVEHGSTIGKNCNISPGAIINGQVKVGDNTAIGAGAIVIQTRQIGSNVIIGAGSVIIKDIEDGSTVVGNPGRVVKIKTDSLEKEA